MERAPQIAHRKLGIGYARFVPRTFKIANHDCVDVSIVFFDPRDEIVREFERADLPRSQRLCKPARAAECKLSHGFTPLQEITLMCRHQDPCGLASVQVGRRWQHQRRLLSENPRLERSRM